MCYVYITNRLQKYKEFCSLPNILLFFCYYGFVPYVCPLTSAYLREVKARVPY